jgi:predicted NUDIX family NTP pyrophosphohydrolase
VAALSAGLVLFRRHGDELQVLLVHPGGPFWARKDLGAWSIPKGEHTEDEDPLQVARREFAEELGSPAPDGPTLSLGEVRQRAGKRVTAWAVEGDLDTTHTSSNDVEMEWPRGRDAGSRSPRWTGPSGSRWTRRAGGSWTVSVRCSTDSRSGWPDRDR